MRAVGVGVLVALAGAGSGWSQQVPADLPPLEQVVELKTVSIRPGATSRTRFEDVSTRIATEAELQALALGDADMDGVLNLRDACPLNPYCQDHPDLLDEDGDGFPAWQDADDVDPAIRLTGDPAIDERPTTDLLSEAMGLVDATEEIVDWALAENAAKGFYSQEAIVVVAEQAGFPAEVIQAWREQYLEPPPVEDCRTCLRRVVEGCWRTPRAPRRKPRRGRCGHTWYRGKLACWREAREACRATCEAEGRPVPRPGHRPDPPRQEGHPRGHAPARPPRPPPPPPPPRTLLERLKESLFGPVGASGARKGRR